MIISKNKFCTKQNISFAKCVKNNQGNLNTNNKSNKMKNAICISLAGLSTAGIAAICLYKKKNKVINAVNENVEAVFKKGLAYNKKGELFNGTISKPLTTGGKFDIKINNGIIEKSTKTSSDGKILLTKEYKKNKYGQKITEIFTTDENGNTELSRKVLISKDKRVLYKGENNIEQYWFNTPHGWKKMNDFIDKSDIEKNQTGINYYLQNGIQINRFLRDGEFGHPDINIDKIHYEYLDDPECPEFAKDSIREVMRDNRLILDTIDELDLLTKSSKTESPITVYRNAPKWWVDQAKNNILEENAFCSTSTVKGASLEGLYVGKHARDGVTYTIHLPKGTPYLDLTSTNEKEMLLPRKGRFRVINNTELEYILD